MPELTFRVLGHVAAFDGAGRALDLRGPRHRAVLARLIVARGRTVPVARLAVDLWPEPPARAAGAIQTFVGALRQALEPERAPRTPARVLVTDGPGYALRVALDAVDAWRFEAAVEAAPALPLEQRIARLDAALALWDGPAYAGLSDDDWARVEAARLGDLRLHATEQRAEARIAAGRAAETAAELDAYVAAHPWRERGWRLLALALYRSARQADALAVLRRAREALVSQLGIDPGPELAELEGDVLRHAEHLAAPSPVEQVWSRAAAAYRDAVPPAAPERLESTITLLRTLAVTGPRGLEAAQTHRAEAIAAAEQTGDPALTARVIGAYDVPAIWSRSDDPARAAHVVAAAERTLRALDDGDEADDARAAVRCRLLSTIAIESRGLASPRAIAAAAEAEAIARRLGGPLLLAFALNGAFMQSTARPGGAARRDELGAELVAESARSGLVSFEVLGHLVRLQARSGLGDFPGAAVHAAAADRLADAHRRPLVGVFTAWARALRVAEEEARTLDQGLAAYAAPLALLAGAGMPGLSAGLPALTRLVLELRFGAPPSGDPSADWGPYRAWAVPALLAARGDRAAARRALAATPDPPADLLNELLWALVAEAAVRARDTAAAARALEHLRPASGQRAGAGSGLLGLGPVDEHVARLTRLLDAAPAPGGSPPRSA